MPFRAALAVVATVVGLFLIFNFKTPDIVTNRTPTAATPIATPTPSASPPPTDTSTSAVATATPSPTATASGLKNGSFTGQTFTNDYGDVQVSVKVAGGRITDVQALTLPSDRQRSAFISQQAAPILHDEVLQAQSAQIDGVSGATYTSDSYAQSVQSALDQAKA